MDLMKITATQQDQRFRKLGERITKSGLSYATASKSSREGTEGASIGRNFLGLGEDVGGYFTR